MLLILFNLTYGTIDQSGEKACDANNAKPRDGEIKWNKSKCKSKLIEVER